MTILETHLVGPSQFERIRLSDYAVGIFESVSSRKGIKKAIKQQRLLVDGEVATTGTWISAGQRIELLVSNQPLAKVFPLDLEVLFEDEDMAIVNKPSGLVVSGNAYQTINNALPHNLKPSSKVDALAYPRAVHRLDILTSGLLIVAKTAQAMIVLGQAFEKRLIQKKYQAIVSGYPEESGVVDTRVDDKEAWTSYQLLSKAPSLKSGQLTWLELSPKTGRKHQIRVHLASIGCPIVGDQRYAPKGKTLKGKGMFLCATGLDFAHPISREPMSFKLDPPAKFEKLMDREYRMWKRYQDARS